MKLLPVVLLNAVVAVAAVVVYDQLRGPDESGPSGVVGEAFDATAIENRLARLEAERQPALRSVAAPDERMAARVEALEARLAALARPAAADQPAEPPADAGGAKPPLAKPTAEPTAEDVARFRRLQQAAREWERANRHRTRIERVLGRLGIELSAKQKQRLADAYVAFQPRRNEIWTEVKQNAEDAQKQDWPTIIRETSARVSREFATTISSFVSAADAEQISSALHGGAK